MKYGMKRKCDDERARRAWMTIGVLALLAGGGTYGTWQALQPSAWMRSEGQALVAKAEGVMSSMETMGADLAGMSRGVEGETEEEENAAWFVENSSEGTKGEASRLRAAWESARGTERDRAAEIQKGLGGGTADAQRQAWEGVAAGIASAKARLSSAVGKPWVWPGAYGTAKAGLEGPLEKAERLAELRNAWAGAREAREAAYAGLKALPRKEGLEAAGRGASARAGALLRSGASMGTDLEGMTRGVDAAEEESVAWHVANCERGLEATARRMADEWRAERGKERARASEVMSGLGNLDAEGMRAAWERMASVLAEKKARLDEALEEMEEHPARYDAAKKELEAALAAPERLWQTRGDWLAARMGRMEAYRELKGLKKSDVLVQGTREALLRFTQEAAAKMGAAKKRVAQSQAERKKTMAEARAQYEQIESALRALHAGNTNTVSTVEASGLPETGNALREMEAKRVADEAAWNAELAGQERHTADMLRVAQAHLEGLKGKDIATEGIERLCREARACTNGYAAVEKALADLQATAAEQTASEAKAAGSCLAQANSILAAQRRQTRDLSAGTERVNEARAELQRMLGDIRKRGNGVRERLDGDAWTHEFGPERRELWNEFDRALQWADEHVPPPEEEDLPNGNALGDAERANDASKRLAARAEGLRQELARRVETAHAVEGSLDRLEALGGELAKFETKTPGEDLTGNFAAERSRLAGVLEAHLENEWRTPLGTATGDGASEALRQEADLARRVAEAKARGEIGPLSFRTVHMPGVLAWGPSTSGKGAEAVLHPDTDSSSLRMKGFPGDHEGGRGKFGMKFSVPVPAKGRYRVMVGAGKDSGHRLLGSNTPKGWSRDIHMASSLGKIDGPKETFTRVVCATTLSGLVMPSKTPVAEFAVEGNGWREEWIDLEFEGEFDMDGVDWSCVYFGVYLTDERGKNPRNIVEKLQHPELERIPGGRF